MRLLAARAASVPPPLPVEIGPGPMPDVLLRALDITIGRRLGGLLAGDYRSPRLGEGTELAQVRPYIPGDDEPRALPPRQGRVGLLGLLGALHREQRSARGATSLGEALSRTGALARQRALVVVISDFRGPRDWRRPLLTLAGRHDVLALEIRDPREQELPNVGELYLVDPETGRQLHVDTRSRRLRERFAAAASAERDDVARELSSLGIRHHVLSTSGDWLPSLAVFLKRGGP